MPLSDLLYVNIFDDDEYELFVEQDEDEVGDMDCCVVCGGDHYAALEHC